MEGDPRRRGVSRRAGSAPLAACDKSTRRVIFRFFRRANHPYISARLTRQEGRLAIVTKRAVGCGGRGCAFDERRGCRWRNRVGLAPRRWCQVRAQARGRRWQESPVTGASSYKPQSYCAGKAGVFPLNLYARVRIYSCILHTGPRVQRAPGLPCALSIGGPNDLQNFGHAVPRDHKRMFEFDRALSRHRPRRRAIQYSRDDSNRTGKALCTGSPACAGDDGHWMGRMAPRECGRVSVRCLKFECDVSTVIARRR